MTETCKIGNKIYTTSELCKIGDKIYTTSELNRIYTFNCETLNQTFGKTVTTVDTLTREQFDILTEIINKFTKKDQNYIQNWINIEKLLGTGAESFNYLSKLNMNEQDVKVVIKKFKNEEQAMEKFKKELIIFKRLRQLRIEKNIPNFLYYIGHFECNDRNIGEVTKICKCDKDCINKTYVVLEYIKGSEFRNIFLKKLGLTSGIIGNLSLLDKKLTSLNISKSSTLDNILNELVKCVIQISKQLALALHMANESIGFIHDDLDQRNVVIIEHNNPVTTTYNFNSKPPIKITSKYIPVILDFGVSSIGNKKNSKYCKDFVAFLNSIHDYSFYKIAAKTIYKKHNKLPIDDDIPDKEIESEINKILETHLKSIHSKFINKLNKVLSKSKFGWSKVCQEWPSKDYMSNLDIYKRILGFEQSGGSTNIYYKKYRKYKAKYIKLKYSF